MEKAAPAQSPPAEEKQVPKTETAPVAEKPKAPSGPPPPPKQSASEPQLPPKDRERRVCSFVISYKFLLIMSTVYSSLIC